MSEIKKKKNIAVFMTLFNMVVSLTMILLFSVSVVRKHPVRFLPSQEHSNRTCSSFDYSKSKVIIH